MTDPEILDILVKIEAHLLDIVSRLTALQSLKDTPILESEDS